MTTHPRVKGLELIRPDSLAWNSESPSCGQGSLYPDMWPQKQMTLECTQMVTSFWKHLSEDFFYQTPATHFLPYQAVMGEESLP